MRRQTLYWLVAGALVCLGAYWFTQNYAFVKERVYIGMQGEARVNWLLAARMLLTRMGTRVQESSDLGRLDRFAARGTIFLAADRNEIDPVSAERLLQWVRGGGHLVISANHPVKHDALLDLLGVSVEEDSQHGRNARAEEVQLPDGARLRVDLLPSAILVDGQENASWSHESHGGVRMLQIPEGDGLVTVLGTFRPFSNSAIGSFDHAELLWQLAANQGQPAEVWLVRHLDVQSLWQWLRENALPVVIAFGVFVVIALWRAVPRFGPLQPSPAPDRRSLLEHLAAMGRFYSMQRQLPKLIQTLRSNGLELLGARAPETRGQDGAAQLKSAARMTGLRPRELLQAFTAPASTPKDFTHAVRVLAAFRLQLTARGRGTDPRRQRGRPAAGPDGKDRRRDHRKRAEFDKAFREARADTKEKA